MKTLFILLALAAATVQAAEPLPDRARWACSREIQARATVPDSVKWTRRSQWPSVLQDGRYHVTATFSASNRMGARLADAQVFCVLSYVAASDDWRLVELRKL